MGAYAPAPCLPPCLCKEAVEQVVKKCIDGLKNEGIVYEGVLYAGLMLTKKGIEVLEFNCRFGYPETEVILPLLDSDLYDIMIACCNHTLASCPVEWKQQSAVTVVAASGGYPLSYKKGFVINGLDKITDSAITVFHAGTKQDNDCIIMKQVIELWNC